MFILGMIGWLIFLFMAILCASNSENRALAIVLMIAGTGFGIMMQLAEIAGFLAKI